MNPKGVDVFKRILKEKPVSMLLMVFWLTIIVTNLLSLTSSSSPGFFILKVLTIILLIACIIMEYFKAVKFIKAKDEKVGSV